MLREGLALWRGEALAGIDSEVLAARDGARLAELRWQATEALADADLRLGRHREVIAGLRTLTAEQPLRERLHGLLMTALYRDGQQAAALAAYQAARTVLAGELGAEPGPELRELHQQILTADPALARPGARRRGRAGGAARAAARHRRVHRPRRRAGRHHRRRHQRHGGGRGGGSAIGGMPGVGKTALAVHAAHRLASQFPDRQLLISLHGHTPGRDPVTPRDALAALLSATGTDPRVLPPDLPERAALWRHRMAGQNALLILDNAASSAQVTPLLPGAPGCLVLVTSRRHLGDLPGAVTPVPLDALAPGQAREMFLRLAPRAAASPQDAVTELAALAGHLPLAISLLARLYARHPAWTLADLAAETRARLLTLTAEHDSVAAALDISCRHLPPPASSSSAPWACTPAPPPTPGPPPPWPASRPATPPPTSTPCTARACSPRPPTAATPCTTSSAATPAPSPPPTPPLTTTRPCSGSWTTTSTPPPAPRPAWPARPGPAPRRPRRPGGPPARTWPTRARRWRGPAPSGPACSPASTTPRPTARTPG